MSQTRIVPALPPPRVVPAPPRRWRDLRAYLRYLKKPTRQFLPLLGLLLFLLVLGGVAFHRLYVQEPLGFRRALFLTYSLIMGEHLVPFPKHWFLQAFYFVLPPLGMIVILDAIVRFSYHVLRRDETGREWVAAQAASMQDHVVLCGLGRGGARVLQQLLRLGEEVVVLERHKESPYLAQARALGVPVLVGAARGVELLEALNVESARSIILCTDDDLANLEMALDARRLQPDIRVVLRMVDQGLAEKVGDAFSIRHAFSYSKIAAPVFAAASSDRHILNAFHLGKRLMVVAALRVRTDSRLAGMTVAELRKKQRALLLCHRRRARLCTAPDDELTLEVGDDVTLQTEAENLRVLHELNRES